MSLIAVVPRTVLTEEQRVSCASGSTGTAREHDRLFARLRVEVRLLSC
jgi:hypothetical protein